tara:strand:- start:1292 stop:1678 length:387 start_codon:yes stop_codon:yes gene_type:complete
MAGSFTTGHVHTLYSYLFINIIMIEWLCNVIFKKYIDAIIDQRFQENAYERIRATRTQELRQRAAAIRATLSTSTHRLSQEVQEELQPSTDVRRSDPKPILQTKVITGTVKKPITNADLKAKLARIKK